MVDAGYVRQSFHPHATGIFDSTWRNALINAPGAFLPDILVFRHGVALAKRPSPPPPCVHVANYGLSIVRKVHMLHLDPVYALVSVAAQSFHLPTESSGELDCPSSVDLNPIISLPG